VKPLPLRIKPFDIAALLLSAGVAIFSAVYVYGGSAQPNLVSIRSESGTAVYPLGEKRTLSVEGPIGETIIEIDGEGSARVTASPCPNKLCIQAGELHRQGDWSACMPNKVFVQIEGGDGTGSEVDTTSY